MQVDIGREFDDNLWSLIEESWSQKPSSRPTAATVSLRLGGVNGCLVNLAEMYKKEIAALTEELASVKERSKAARQDLETELARRDLEQAELRKNLNEERDLRKRLEKNADELEQAELKKDLDEEKDLRKQVEKNADERSKLEAASQYLETELANFRDSLAKRELEQAELKKNLNEERDLRKRLEKNADERIKTARQGFKMELAKLRHSLAKRELEQTDLKAARQDLETELAKLRDSLARGELELAELKMDLDEERDMRKQLEKNTDERSKPEAASQYLETELAYLRDSLAKRELEQAELKKDLDEERDMRKQLEKNTDDSDLLISFLLSKR